MLATELRVEQRGRQRAQLVEGGGEPRLVLQAVEPHLRVQAVVRLLAVDLPGEPGDLRSFGPFQLVEPPRVRLLVQVVPRDRLLPVEQPQLDDRCGAVILR